MPVLLCRSAKAIMTPFPWFPHLQIFKFSNCFPMAFDRGLITIDTNYKVRVSKVFNENNSNYGLKQFEGKEISLPHVEKYYPLMDNFAWHGERIYKG